MPQHHLFRRMALAAALLLAVPTLRPLWAAAATTTGCTDCHEKTVAAAMGQQYVHAPFRRQACDVCHVEKPAGSAGEGLPNGAEPEALLNLGAHSQPARNHWFVLPFDRLGRRILVELSDGSGGRWQRQFILPPRQELLYMDNDQTPPQITGVRVLKIERGLFLTATIGWHTDEMADSTVRYGVVDARQEEVRSSQWTREHRVTLFGLKPGRRYRFAVGSADIFGNRAQSDPIAFSTEAASAAGIGETAADRPSADTGGRLQLASELFAIDDHLVFGLKASRAVTISLAGLPPGERRQDLPGNHAPLRGSLALNYGVCGACHDRGTCQHPIKVVPPASMEVPLDYPRLADGQITCMTCHAVHASDHEFRLLRPTRSELCVGCHAGKRAALSS